MALREDADISTKAEIEREKNRLRDLISANKLLEVHEPVCCNFLPFYRTLLSTLLV